MRLLKNALIITLLFAVCGLTGQSRSMSVPGVIPDSGLNSDSGPSADNQKLGFKYLIDVSDAKRLLTGEERSGVESNLRAALEFWGQVVRGKGTVDVQITVSETTSLGRFQGGCTNTMFRAKLRGHTIVECGTTYELRTGVDPNGASPDVTIRVPAEYLRARFWIDPAPQRRRDPVPPDKGDLVSVLAHEIGHGLGFTGFIDSRTLAFTVNNYLSLFDSFVQLASTPPMFAGPNAMAANGGNPVTLCHGSLCRQDELYHLRTVPYRDRLREPYVYGLMSGDNFHKGMRYRLAPAEIAILKDLGLTVN
jgi:hypothetical protein